MEINTLSRMEKTSTNKCKGLKFEVHMISFGRHDRNGLDKGSVQIKS